MGTSGRILKTSKLTGFIIRRFWFLIWIFYLMLHGQNLPEVSRLKVSAGQNHTGLLFLSISLILISGFDSSFSQSAANHSNQADPVITVDFSQTGGNQIKPSLLGANNPMPHTAVRADYDTAAQTFPQGFYDAIRTVGVKSLRFPGGNVSGSYHWEFGIGPVSARPEGFDGSTGINAPHYYWFGFMEFMDFLEDAGCSDPVICINFGTGTADEASAWVEFANAAPGTDPNGDGIDHGRMRADLGHPDPYNIQRWEIGNELGDPYKHMFSWHFGQQSNLGEDYTKTVRNYIFGGSQWQHMDMSQRQLGQSVVKPSEWSLKGCLSDGTPDQEFFVKYPPVWGDSLYLGVWLDSLTVEQWFRAPDFSQAGPDDKVFLLDSLTGKITFGDGQQGQIPHAGGAIKVVYKSIDQDGLIDFYDKMKAADPSVLIGVPFEDSAFFQEVQNAGFTDIPFDFMVDHPYVGAQPNDLEVEHWRMHWYAFQQASLLENHRANLDGFFGGQKEIGILITEYNYVSWYNGREGNNSNPWYGGEQKDFFGRSLDQGLFVAGALMSYLRKAEETGLWALDIHSLVPDEDHAIAGWGLTSLMGPPPHQYLNPAGKVYTLFTACNGFEILEPQKDGIPEFSFTVESDRQGQSFLKKTDTDTVSLAFLDALAFRSVSGDTAVLFVINRASALPEAGEPVHDIAVTLRFQNGDDFDSVIIDELNAPHLWSVNSGNQPGQVTVQSILEQAYADSLEYTFPAHTLTAIRIVNTQTGIQDKNDPDSPFSFRLYQNYPNPFNPVTKIRFDLPKTEHVELTVYNLLGREVRRLVNQTLKAGQHEIEMDARHLAGGLYFYRIKTASNMKIRKMTLLK